MENNQNHFLPKSPEKMEEKKTLSLEDKLEKAWQEYEALVKEEEELFSQLCEKEVHFTQGCFLKRITNYYGSSDFVQLDLDEDAKAFEEEHYVVSFCVNCHKVMGIMFRKPHPRWWDFIALSMDVEKIPKAEWGEYEKAIKRIKEGYTPERDTLKDAIATTLDMLSGVEEYNISKEDREEARKIIKYLLFDLMPRTDEARLNIRAIRNTLEMQKKQKEAL